MGNTRDDSAGHKDVTHLDHRIAVLINQYSKHTVRF